MVDHGVMPKQSTPADFAQNALRIAELATGGTLNQSTKRNPAAVALGRLGGLKGGKARKAALTKDERVEIAKKAAAARWKKAD
jgi:hypothetical protein